MLYPVVAFVPVVYNGNSFRVVGYPYPLFFININVIDEEFYKLKYCSTVVYMVPRA
jgi:hypothetical protein